MMVLFVAELRRGPSSGNWTNLLGLFQNSSYGTGQGSVRDFDLDASIYFNGSFTDFF